MKNSINKSHSIVGIITSLYMALAYLGGIIIFIFLLRYPEITGDVEKVNIIIEKKNMIFITNLILYVLFGPALILFILFLNTFIEDRNNLIVKFSTIIGYIWAGSLTASGMIANGSIEPIISIFYDNQVQAIYLWKMLDIVSLSIGNGNGEILGGIMTLGFGFIMLKEKHFSKILGLFGIIIGIIGIVSLVPFLSDFTIMFGLLQLIWFLASGFSSLKIVRKSDLYRKK